LPWTRFASIFCQVALCCREPAGGISDSGELELAASHVTGNTANAGEAGGIRNVGSGQVTLLAGSTVTGNTDPQCTGTEAC
jgi:hypothetical protein